jgi:Type I restriction modification DNA specificity domain
LERALLKLNAKKLHSIATFSSETWNQRDFYNEIFPYIEISEIDLISGAINNISQVAIKDAPSRAKMVARTEDILISMTRPNRGAICYIQNNNEILIASTGFSIIRKISIEVIRKYLFYFLRSSFSLKQMERRVTGGNYPAITQDELGNILIPIPSKEIQRIFIQKSDSTLKEKEKKEKKAENILSSFDEFVFEKLGVDLEYISSKPIDERIYKVKHHKAFNNRLDPYYHQKQFDAYYNAFSNRSNLIKLKELTTAIFTGKTPPKDKYSQEPGKIIVKAGSLKGNEVNWEKISYANECTLSPSLVDYDILLLSAAHQISYIGKNPSIVTIPEELKNKDLHFVGELLCIRPDPLIIYPYYLLAILKTKFYYQLVNRETRGQTSHLYPGDVSNIKIPIPHDIKVQKIISDELQARLKEAEKLFSIAELDYATSKKEIENLILE